MKAGKLVIGSSSARICERTLTGNVLVCSAILIATGCDAWSPPEPTGRTGNDLRLDGIPESRGIVDQRDPADNFPGSLADQAGVNDIHPPVDTSPGSLSDQGGINQIGDAANDPAGGYKPIPDDGYDPGFGSAYDDGLDRSGGNSYDGSSGGILVPPGSSYYNGYSGNGSNVSGFGDFSDEGYYSGGDMGYAAYGTAAQQDIGTATLKPRLF